MHVYFAPLACSMATRIALYDAGADAEYICVDTKTKRLPDGSSYLQINPMGQVVALRTDDGVLLTENTAVLQYVADRLPASNLTPLSAVERAQLQQWLGFIATELQKAIFIPLLDPKAPEGAKAYAREKVAVRLDLLQKHLSQHEYLLNRFTVADAYLITVLNWAQYCNVDLSQWPAVKTYYERLLKRPSIAKALAEEQQLFAEEQARRAAS